LLSPVKLGPYVLKSRFVSANSLPHFLQGPETFPNDQVINHVVSLAKNGAAIVTFADWTNPKQRVSFNEDGKRFPMYDISDPSVENYLCQLVDQVHYYNSRISIAIMPFAAFDPVYDVSDVPAVDLSVVDPLTAALELGMGVVMRGGKAGKQLTHEQIRELIEFEAQRIYYYKKLGYDMTTLHFAYRATLFSRFLSPLTNKRTDEYGGPIENRARFLIEFCSRIKQLCGKDFPIEVQLTGSETGGTTIEETIKMAKLCEGLVDIFQFRAETGNLNHPTGYNSREHEYESLADCAAVKASGTSILCEVIGGLQDLDDAEEIIASGKADLIGGARAFFVDFDYYKKALEGRGEDVIPCVRCNKCHVSSMEGKWVSFCTVNPTVGIAHKLDKLVDPLEGIKNVAVVGGGPAGMRAALMTAERGHKVTLFEKADSLGGQLKIMDYPSFKWPLKRYREYLKKQLEKAGVDIRLNTNATPDSLKDGNYDAVIVAIGSKPKLPPISGADKAWNILDVFGNEDKLGHRVVVIGGSESGTEAAMYLAENGHAVTLLTRQNKIAPDATPIHYREMLEEYFNSLKELKAYTGATATGICDGYVIYTDKDGNSKRIECDSVVALGGMQALQDEAMAFYGIARQTFMIGDCYEVGCVRDCNRSAFAAANQI
jgi:2,4-dienoyl-CoA reductase-like NADH-dependent reductase (Old Yellow Enzyme family)/thioredoxin reductase